MRLFSIWGSQEWIRWDEQGQTPCCTLLLCYVCIKQIGYLDPLPILDCFLNVRVDAGPLDQMSGFIKIAKQNNIWQKLTFFQNQQLWTSWRDRWVYKTRSWEEATKTQALKTVCFLFYRSTKKEEFTVLC